MKFCLGAIAFNTLLTDRARASAWSYKGKTGTDFWDKLDPEYRMCNSGKAQSPINLQSGVGSKINSLELNYRDTPLAIENNGRTIKVNYQPGSSLSLDGRVYELLQFHFHQPSEHLVFGRAFEMEAHFVHQNKATGDFVVLAVLMSEGKLNRAIATIWQRITQSEAQEVRVADLTIDALQLLPEHSDRYYRYQGSLTTPPCSENVTWLILKQPVEISRAQITRFFEVIGNNARPVRSLNQRSLVEVN